MQDIQNDISSYFKTILR